MSSLSSFLNQVENHIGNSSQEILTLARSIPNKPVPYERIVSVILSEVHDTYRLQELKELGPTSPEPKLITRAFEKLKVVLPSRNPQSSEDERALEKSLMSLIEYAALANEAKKRVLDAIKSMRIMDSRGQELERGIKSSGS